MVFIFAAVYRSHWVTQKLQKSPYIRHLMVGSLQISKLCIMWSSNPIGSSDKCHSLTLKCFWKVKKKVNLMKCTISPSNQALSVLMDSERHFPYNHWDEYPPVLLLIIWLRVRVWVVNPYSIARYYSSVM